MKNRKSFFAVIALMASPFITWARTGSLSGLENTIGWLLGIVFLYGMFRLVDYQNNNNHQELEEEDFV